MPEIEQLTGDQTPRILFKPPGILSSAGQDAVDLAASAGLILDPWQQYALDVGLGERENGKWAAFEVGLIVARQNGKGSILEARELAGLFLFGEELILHSAHEFKTSKEAFTRICRLIQNSPALASRVKAYPRNPSEFGIDLHTGQRLRFIARSSTSGRGYSADVTIMDEAFKLNAEGMAALLPTLSSRPNPQVWYASSAAMATSEQLHAVRKRALAGEDKRLAYLEWSAPEDCDPYDRRSWVMANPALGYRIEEEFIEAEAQALTVEAFRRERLSIPDEMMGESILAQGLWDACRDAGSKLEGKLTFCVDMRLDRSAASISVAGRRNDGKIHVEVIDNREGTAWIVPRIQELVKRWKPGQLLLDAGGPAGSILRDLQDLGIEPKLVGLREFAQACGAFYDAVTTNELRHLGQPSLDASISGAVKRKVGDLWTFNRAGEIDTSPLVSCAIAFWGVSNRKGRTRVINLAAALEAADESSKETQWQPQEISPLQQTSQEDSTEPVPLDQSLSQPPQL